MKTLLAAMLLLAAAGCADIEPAADECQFVGETRWCRCDDGFRGQQFCPQDHGTRRTACDCSEDRAGLLERRLRAQDAGAD